jgi:hypothetical protein
VLAQELAGNCSGSHPGYCFSGRGTTTTTMIPYTVLSLVGKITMTGPKYILQMVIGF